MADYFLKRLFIGVYPTGLIYSDREREEHSNYKLLATLPFHSLQLTIEPECPNGLRSRIEAHAATIQAMRGQQFQISTAGQTVRLGE